mgnify:CR=1 FL=1
MKEGKTINQEDIKVKADELVRRRADLVSSMDQQIDISQDMYTKLDGCIDNLDENVKSLNALLASDKKRGGKRGDKQKKSHSSLVSYTMPSHDSQLAL